VREELSSDFTVITEAIMVAVNMEDILHGASRGS
jgi:hypothetical protein